MQQCAIKLIFKSTIALVSLVTLCMCDEDTTCDRRPLGTKTDPLPPDNRFAIEILGIRDEHYIPQENYTVRLFSRDESTFIAFTISLQEDTTVNEVNPRRPIMLKAGRLETLRNATNTKYKRHCSNTIVETDISPKKEVEVLWVAPDKGNKCVTVFAVVATKPDEWYTYEEPLSQRVCEDRRKAEDMPPIENDNCEVCEDARYKLTFEGMWSYNTHQNAFPKAEELARFSDVVGASHNKNFPLYKYNSEASEGLKMLAEQGNTTQMENEIQDWLGINVRTVIKATSPPKTNMSTVTHFRVTREHHFVSLVTALLPSPDWFLGVANFELCDVTTKYWVKTLRFNLYPLDAGTDKGTTFESANEETSPHQPISVAEIQKSSSESKESMKPFARLQFDLVRTYDSRCTSEASATTEKGEERNTDDENSEPVERTQEPPVAPASDETSEQPTVLDPESSDRCPMTTWQEWGPCEGDCINGKVQGYHSRFRKHMVDNVAVEKGEGASRYCIQNFPDSEYAVCEEDCEENKAEAEGADES